jgi:adenosylcobinamide-GDP ribazoletransferase
VRAAREGGFGALVAGRSRAAVAVPLTILVLAAGAGLGAAVRAGPVTWVSAQAVGLLAAWVLRAHAGNRLGVTGDVFGALVETAQLVTLLVVALSPA